MNNTQPPQTEIIKQQLVKLTGQRGIYIESLTGCIVKIKKVWFDKDSVFLLLISDGNLIKRYGQQIFGEEDCPFGNEWEVSRLFEMLYFDNDYLDASLYSGWRLVVNENAVELFEKKDSSWEENYW